MSKKHYTSFPKSQTELNHLIFDTFSDSDFDRYNIRIEEQGFKEGLTKMFNRKYNKRFR